MNGLSSLVLYLSLILGGCAFEDDGCMDCDQYRFKIKHIGHLPKEIKESSGLARYKGQIFTHGDSGTDAVVFGITYPFFKDGKSQVYKFPDVENIDWEELAADGHGNIFIGDFGNNANTRKDLRVYQWNPSTSEISSLSFSYRNQSAHPPTLDSEKNFDLEAMIWHKEKLYLFSKNVRNDSVLVYQLDPKIKTHQILAPVDTLITRNTFVTGADISPAGDEMVLASYGKLLFYDVQTDPLSARPTFRPKMCRKVNQLGQVEAIIYLGSSHLLATNEKGKVFLIYRKYKKASEPFEPEEVIFKFLQ